jgi:germination protein M
LLAVACICAGLAGCSIEEEPTATEDGNQYYLYYIDSTRTKLVKESYVPDTETADFMLPDLMAHLNSQDNGTSGQTLLPEGVQINFYEITDSVLQIEFNNDYTQMDPEREILARMGVVKTFLQVPGITAVKFFVGKNELTDSKGEPLGEMTASTFVEDPAEGKEAYRYDTFTLYFTDKEGKNLVEETRRVYYKRSIPREKVALEQLAKGPMEKNHYPTIPENSELLSLVISDGIGYVDFNHMFEDYALTDVDENIAIYSVVNTLIAASSVDRVQISIDGNAEATFRDNMNLYNFYKWNEGLILREEE